MTPKQARFVAEYLIDLNATQAAIRAGYSPRTASEQGTRLLGKAQIAKAVADAQAKRLARLDLTADRVLQEIARIAFSDIRTWFTAEGKLRPIHELPTDVAAALGSVEVRRERTRRDGEAVTEEDVVKLKAWDKPRALDMLAKHFGLVRERHEHTGRDGSPLRLASDADIDARIALLEQQVKG